MMLGIRWTHRGRNALIQDKLNAVVREESHSPIHTYIDMQRDLPTQVYDIQQERPVRFSINVEDHVVMESYTCF